jgi:hypothetical protein
MPFQIIQTVNHKSHPERAQHSLNGESKDAHLKHNINLLNQHMEQLVRCLFFGTRNNSIVPYLKRKNLF